MAVHIKLLYDHYIVDHSWIGCTPVSKILLIYTVRKMKMYLVAKENNRAMRLGINYFFTLQFDYANYVLTILEQRLSFVPMKAKTNANS